MCNSIGGVFMIEPLPKGPIRKQLEEYLAEIQMVSDFEGSLGYPYVQNLVERLTKQGKCIHKAEYAARTGNFEAALAFLNAAQYEGVSEAKILFFTDNIEGLTIHRENRLWLRLLL